MILDDTLRQRRLPAERRLSPILGSLRTVAVALVSRDGDLVDAGRGFRDVLTGAGLDSDDLDIRDLFINPRFDEFAARPAQDPEGIVWRGILNLGTERTAVRSLQGTIFSWDDDLLVVAEPYVVQLEQAAAEILKLNEELAEGHRRIIGLQQRLRARESEIRGALADRESLFRVLASTSSPQEKAYGAGREAPSLDEAVSAGGLLHLEWSEDMSVGVNAIDRQHDELIRHYHAFVRALTPGNGTATARPAFGALIDAARRHFADEERVMRNIGFPGYFEHRDEHVRLLEDAENFMASIGAGLTLDDCTAIAKYVRYWLLKHTREQDRKIRAFINR